MKTRLASTLLAAALAVLPALSHARDGVRWETLRVYTLAGGDAVAVAVPAEWQQVDEARVLHSALRFVDESGAEVAIPVAALARAAAEKRVFRPGLTAKVALAASRAR
jgi:hypothetical protein